MRTLRSSLAPIAFGALVVLGVAVLMPGAGVRVHRHARGESGHVHLDDLLTPTGRHRHPGERHSPHHHHHHRPVDAHHPGEPRLDGSGTRSDETGPGTLALPPLEPAHAHASPPFLRSLPAAIAAFWLALQVLATPAGRPLTPCRAFSSRPRARSPPRSSPFTRPI